jgi:hypothetical protein
MAGRFRSLRTQGNTGRSLIAPVAVAVVVLVMGGGAGRAQAQTLQPPPFVEPAEKPRAPAPAEKPAAEKPAADKPPGDKPPGDKPPASQTPPAQTPPASQTPPVQTPPGQTPPAQSPPAQPPAYAPYPYAPTYPYAPYPYAPQYPPATGYPPSQYPAPGYPPQTAYPPQPSWPPPAAYPPPAAAYPPPAAAYPPSAPGGGQVPTLTGYAAPPPPAPSRAPVVDPQGDRVVLLPTATTHPQGTFYFSNYELVVFQLGYAFTDRTQMSLTAIPVASESVAALDVSLKSSVYRGELVRAAAIGSASGVVGKDVGVAFLGRAGAVVQVCMARHCESSLSLSSNAILIGSVLMVNGAGGIWRVSPHMSLLAELATMLPVGKQGGQFNGGLVSGGLRLHYSHWGFDFTLMHVLDSSDDVATLPFFAMTWRP